jgi:hypothetical protein
LVFLLLYLLFFSIQTLFFKCPPKAINLGTNLIYSSIHFNSFSSDASHSNHAIVPVKSYKNADTLKFNILKENQKKSGIYRWVNNVNGKSYIGSALDITRRLRNYYSIYYLEKSNMAISKGLLKYGYFNFSLHILEYCDESILLKREQYYLDLLKPEYYILKVAGNSLGFQHSDDTKLKISEAHLGKLVSEATPGPKGPWFLNRRFMGRKKK